MRIFTLALTAFMLFPLTAKAEDPVSYDIGYSHGDTQLNGYWRNSECENEAPAPVILIVHQWKGLSAHERHAADMLAKQCYNAFAIDMYGVGIRPETNEAAAAESSKYKNDPELARDRLQNALTFAKEKAGTNKAGIIGYCFGGTMALELARSGADIAAATSFHGGLGTQSPVTTDGVIKAAVQVHHGDADKYVPAAEVEAFLNEMRTSGAEWHFTRYADAVHAFTHEDAGNNPSKGVAYNEAAAKQSWASTLDFLKMELGK